MSSLFLVLPLLAAAPEPTAIQDPFSPPTWYGNQTLLADGAATLLVGGAFVAGRFIVLGSPAAQAQVTAQALTTLLGLSVYLVGAPFIHLHHGQGWVALRDFAMRLFPPVPGFICGALVAFVAGLDPVGGGFIGAAIVGLIAIVTDAAQLAWTPAGPAWKLPGATPAERSSFRLTPVVGASCGGAPFAGIGGRF